MAERRGRLSASESDRLLTLLEVLQIEMDDLGSRAAARAALPLARRHRLTAYDAAYLELAIRKGFPLATRDRDPLKACRAAGVALFSA